MGCRGAGVIEDTGACNASGGCSAFRPESGRNQLGEVFDGQFQVNDVAQNGLADPGECFLDELQGALRGCVTSLGIVVIFIIVIIVLTPLASEVVDLLELAALFLELVDEGVEMSLIGIQAPFKLDGGQGGWGYGQGGRFDDIVVLDSPRRGSLTRRLTALGRAFGRRELLRGFVLPGVLFACAAGIRGWHR